MGWETRRGKRYYYRKIWVGDGKVKSVYCGSGERGEAAAREDEERRAACATPTVANIGDVKKSLPSPLLQAKYTHDTPTRAGWFASLLTSQPNAREDGDQNAPEPTATDDGGTVDTSTCAGEPTPFEVAARLGFYGRSYGSAGGLSRCYAPPRRRYRPPRS